MASPAKLRNNSGVDAILANPVTGETLVVRAGDTVNKADWPGLADNPNWAPPPHKAKKAPASGEGGGSSS